MSDAEPGDHGARRRARDRAAAEEAATAGPSAARWSVPEADGEVVVVDVVADLLALGSRARLRGRGDAPLRALAAHVDRLVQAGAVTPSGRPLLEVVVADVGERLTLAPAFSLDALFGGGDPRGGQAHDRTVRLATALLERARAHRAGEVDLHALVAPVGLGRHPRADELETLTRVATTGLVSVSGPDPAVVTHERDGVGGWVGVSEAELFLAAATGLLDGAIREVAGAVLARWLARVPDEPDAWWFGLAPRVTIDAVGLLHDAAARAGSDHPEVIAGGLVDLIASRHPLRGEP